MSPNFKVENHPRNMESLRDSGKGSDWIISKIKTVSVLSEFWTTIMEVERDIVAGLLRD